MKPQTFNYAEYEKLKEFADYKTKLCNSLIEQVNSLQDELAEYNCNRKIGCKLIEDVKSELEQVKRERDAAVADIMCRDHCDVCKYSKYDGSCDESDFDCETCKNACPCATCRNENKWEWRGMKGADHERN